MSSWDVFLGETLELQRGLSTRQVQAGLVAGDFRDDDLARPAGTKDPWLPISQIGELRIPGLDSEAPLSSPGVVSDFPKSDQSPDSLAPTVAFPEWFDTEADDDDISFPVIQDVTGVDDQSPQIDDASGQAEGLSQESEPDRSAANRDESGEEDDEVDDFDGALDESAVPVSPFNSAPANPADSWEIGRSDPDLGRGGRSPNGEDSSSKVALPVVSDRSSHIALPVVASRDWSGAAAIDQGEDGDAEEEVFTFSRRSANKVEELDLAPMVDVAFQLVLFFMVTATTVLYKTLEVPKPSGDSPPGAVAQGRAKSVDDLRDDFIVVEIDPTGTFKIDREPVEANMDVLVGRLRDARDKTARLTMLLSADYSTPHRFAVLAIDAANEIGLRIAVARPPGKQAQAPAPTLFPINPQGGAKAKAARDGA